MEAKKTPKADLISKEGLYFSIGLVLSMSLVHLAFNWKQYERSEVELIARNSNTFEEIIEVPATEIPPTPEITVIQPQLVEVPNEEEIKNEINIVFDVEVTEDTKVEEYVAPPVSAIEDEESEKIFTIVEHTAEPKGGLAAFYQYVSENIKYPAQARRMGIEGKVYVEFIVGKDGKIYDVKTVNELGAGCDEEAVRIIQNAPPWNPGKQRGKPVKQKMVMPIIFRLADRR
ncbi:MAG TPA: energy transducer TonB [Cytophagales bacterium]|nr:energy transducer TonB [Cyclobacteriaceae bacterium]HAC23381.1 energy transducer TonB [Cytophagales bacterium]